MEQSQYLPPRRYLPPNNLSHLLRRIYAVNAPCTCEVHAPELYTICQRLHEPLADVDTNIQMSKIKLAQRPAYRRPEALALARLAIASFSVPEDEMTPMQQGALANFRALKLRKFGWQHGGKALAAADVQNVWQMFNEIFFFGMLEIKFSWKEATGPEEQARGLRVLGYCLPDGQIHLDPVLVRVDVGPKDYDARTTSRLSTLLHEAIHAYIFQHACEECATFDVNVKNANWHGRAFQVLKKALEEHSGRLLGMTLQTSGFLSFSCNWNRVEHWPSVHDVEVWGWLQKEKLFQDYNTIL